MQKLKLPLWEDIVYFCFMMVAPIVITAIELYSAHTSYVTWSLTTIGCILILLILVKHFAIQKLIDKYNTKCILLEHDYDIDVGNKTKIIQQWKYYKLTEVIYNAIMIICIVAFGVIFINALISELIKFRGASLLIASAILLGLVFKVLCLSFVKPVKEKEVEDGTASQ